MMTKHLTVCLHQASSSLYTTLYASNVRISSERVRTCVRKCRPHINLSFCVRALAPTKITLASLDEFAFYTKNNKKCPQKKKKKRNWMDLRFSPRQNLNITSKPKKLKLWTIIVDNHRWHGGGAALLWIGYFEWYNTEWIECSVRIYISMKPSYVLGFVCSRTTDWCHSLHHCRIEK